MKITSLDNISGVTIIFDFKKPLILKIRISLIKSATGVFNFGPQIRKWIKTLYTNISNCVINNGHTSEFLMFKEELDKVALYPVFYLFYARKF